MITAAARLAASSAASATGGTAAAVLVAVAIIGIWRYALPGKDAKGTIPGRLAAIVLFLVVCWVLLAVTHAAAAMQLAGGAASGITTLFGAVARLV